MKTTLFQQVAIFVFVSTVLQPVAALTFTPIDITETFDEDLFPVDDDVDISGSMPTGIILGPGQSLTWDHDYMMTYQVLSGDMADIDFLTITGTGSPTSMAVSVNLTGPDGQAVGNTFSPMGGALVTGGTTRLIDDFFPGSPDFDGDNVLGNLQNLVVADFHIEISNIGTGIFTIDTIEFGWEASDIEKVFEPSTLALLVLGIFGIGFSKRRHK